MVVGGRARGQRVRPAPGSPPDSGAERRVTELGVGGNQGSPGPVSLSHHQVARTWAAHVCDRVRSWSRGAVPNAASEPIVRLLPGSGRRAATPAEQHALAMLAREGAVPRRQLVNRVAHEL